MNIKTLPPVIFIMGPTASGKTHLAIDLFEHFPVELISVDSALVFRDMDIGTAKPDTATLQKAPHHLINIIPPTKAYSAANFRTDALNLMADITARGKVPVLVGGTMMYFKTLEGGLSGLPEANPEIRLALDEKANLVGWPAMHATLAQIDAETAARLKPNDMQRIQRALEVHAITGETMTQLYAKQITEVLPYNLLKIALVPSDRKSLHQRIALRFRQMLAAGFLDEVKAIQKAYPSLTTESTSMRCVGYRQVLAHLNGDYDLSELQNRGVFATRQLAKRQLTWLRSMEDVLEYDCLEKEITKKIKNDINQFIKKIS